MKYCVTCIYWVLLLTSFVSSWLLFLVVASENTEGRIPSVLSESDGSPNVFENVTADIRNEKYEVPEIVIARVQNPAIENEFLEESATKVSSSFDTINTLDDGEESDLEIIAESVIQQPNLSQGISETGQAVVLTLVDTAAAELQSLAEPKIELDSRSSVKNSSLKSSNRRYTEDIDDARPSTQIPKPATIEEENIEESNNTNVLLEEDELLDLHGTQRRNINENTADIVVVVRAEQKVTVDVADAVRSATEDEVEQVLPDELAKVEEGFGTASELNDTAARARLISEGNRDDVAAAVIIDGLVASGSADSHEDIPSFSEWAQKRLEEAEKKKTHPNASVQNPGGPGRGMGGMKVRSKNYASPDCGAKIVAVNPEAQHAKSVLAATRDEYMLNTCTSRVWFVVELCEAIQAKKIELANFELFSSSPKEFSVYVSDRFPTRDWSPVGHFTAKDERDIQSFTLHPQLFGQFIKVELQSHYGSEHFCPISLFRAYGTSEFEVLETETENQRETDGEDDEDSDEEEILDADGVPSNLFGSARDAVLSIVKKAAEVLVKSSDLTGNNITKIQQSIDAGTILDNSYDTCTTPRYTILCAKCSDQNFAKIFQLVGCREQQLDDLLKNNLINQTLRQDGLCIDHGIDLSLDNKIKEERKDEPKSKARNLRATFFSSVFKPEYIVALCNVLATKERKVVMNVSYEIPSNESENVTEKDDTLKAKITDKVNDVPVAALSSSQIVTPPTVSSKDGKQRQEPLPDKLETTASTLVENLSISESLTSQIKPTKTLNKEDLGRKEPSLSSLEPSKEMPENTLQADVITTSPPITNLPTPTLKIAEETATFGSTETVPQTVTTVPIPNYASQDANGNLPHPVVESGETNMQSKIEKTEKAESVGTKKLEQMETDGKGKTESGEQEAKLPSQDHLNFDTLLSDLKDLENDAINLHNGPAASSNTHPTASTTPQQKESVFLRLSNRIKALERNMSLSGQYLEELSRRYKKQVEEMQRSLERAITTMSEESRKGEERDLKRLEEIATLREEIAVLSKSVESILQDQDSWRGRLSAIGQHALLICLEVFVVIIVLSYCRRASDYEEDEEEQTSSKKAAVRRKSAENFSSGNVLSKKIKKRRPSEIASHISSTYHDLMIDDHCQETKKERKRKRKKEANAKVVANMEGKREAIKYKSTSSLVPTSTLASASKRSSSSDLSKVEDIQGQSSQAKKSEYITEIANDQSNEQKIVSSTKESVMAHEKNLYLACTSEGAEFTETRLFSTNTDTVLASTSEVSDFSKNGSSKYGGIRWKEGKLSSPSFMKTALGARKKRSSGSINNTQTQGKDEKWETNSGNSSSDRLSPKENPVTLRTFSESIGNANGNAANGLLDESDESRCSSVTPTSWKKEKKSSGLKKMVRKIF